jgi:hypothetical protein
VNGGGPQAISAGGFPVQLITEMSQGGGQAHVHPISLDGLHAHNVTVTPNDAHSHGIVLDGAHQHSVTVPTQPPFFALAYIMKL